MEKSLRASTVYVTPLIQGACYDADHFVFFFGSPVFLSHRKKPLKEIIFLSSEANYFLNCFLAGRKISIHQGIRKSTKDMGDENGRS